GAAVARKPVLMTIAGDARALLAAERVALNFVGHLSGVATAAAEFVRLIAHTRARVCCTRKTTPGLRAPEKYAVRCGGGFNHRFGFDDAILIKDNHIAVAGGIRPVLERAKAVAGHLVKIEIEVDTLDQLKTVLEVGLADAVVLDNMDPATMKQAVGMVAGARAMPGTRGGDAGAGRDLSCSRPAPPLAAKSGGGMGYRDVIFRSFVVAGLAPAIHVLKREGMTDQSFFTASLVAASLPHTGASAPSP